MSGTPATSAAPKNAAKVWTDTRYIYTEIPGKLLEDGSLIPAAVFKFPLTEGGLSKALAIHKAQIYEYARQPMPSNVARRSMNPRIAAAQAILRKNGILKG